MRQYTGKHYGSSFYFVTHKHKYWVKVSETYLLILEFLAGDSAPLRSWRKYWRMTWKEQRKVHKFQIDQTRHERHQCMYRISSLCLDNNRDCTVYFEAGTTKYLILSLFSRPTAHAGQWPAVDNGRALVHPAVFNEAASEGWNSAWQLGLTPVLAHWLVERLVLMTRPILVGGWEIGRG